MKVGIVILGFGKEIEYVVKNCYKMDIPILAYGYEKKNEKECEEIVCYCKENGIQIIKHYSEIVRFNPEFVFMMSYSPLIPKEYIDRYKFVNVHGALVPRYRGMHGGTWSIINGESEHGYTVHLIDEGIDSGPIFHQGRVVVGVNDNINKVRELITNLFCNEIMSVISSIYNNEVIPEPQNEEEAIYVCRRKPEDSIIDWNKNSKDIHNLIRALTPPYTDGAYTFYKGDKLFIEKSSFIERPVYKGINGQVVAKYKDKGILIKTGDSVILIEKIKYKGICDVADKFFSTVGARFYSLPNKN